MLNKVTLIGRLGKDPDFRTTPAGVSVARFSLATDEKRKTQDGSIESRTEWHRVVLFRRQAEVARDYLRKGSLIYLEGKIHYDSYEDRDGRKVYTTEILGDDLKFLDTKGSGQQDPVQRPEQAEPKRASADDGMGSDDDLPF